MHMLILTVIPYVISNAKHWYKCLIQFPIDQQRLENNVNSILMKEKMRDSTSLVCESLE